MNSKQIGDELLFFNAFDIDLNDIIMELIINLIFSLNSKLLDQLLLNHNCNTLISYNKEITLFIFHIIEIINDENRELYINRLLKLLLTYFNTIIVRTNIM